MTSNQGTERPAGTELKQEQWLICPICKQPNPGGTLHCKFCWGASLYSVKPISSAALAEFNEKRQKQIRHLRFIRTLAIGISAPVILIAVVMFWLYSFTDLIFTPPEHLNSAPLGSDWTMYRHDPSRTGAIDITTSPKGELLWSFETGSEIASSPTVVNGIVYFGSRDHKLYALDANTGQKKWEFRTGSWVESSPAVVNGVVYFGCNDGKFYALDAATGNKLWDFQTRYAIKSSPAVAGNMVFFGGDDYFVYAVDAGTGKKIWQYETESHVNSSPVISEGILYIGSNDMSCYALNAETGRFRLRMKVAEVISAPVVKDSTVYFTSHNYLFAMDGRARNWPYEHDFRPWWLQFYAFHLAPPPPPRSGVMWGMRIAISNSNTTPVLEGNYIYTTGDNKVLKIDLSTRKNVWTPPFAAGAMINSSPALANNVIYVGCDNGRLYAIDAETGKGLWDFRTGAKITSSPTYANGVVYVTSWDRKIYAIK